MNIAGWLFPLDVVLTEHPLGGNIPHVRANFSFPENVAHPILGQTIVALFHSLTTDDCSEGLFVRQLEGEVDPFDFAGVKIRPRTLVATALIHEGRFSRQCDASCKGCVAEYDEPVTISVRS